MYTCLSRLCVKAAKKVAAVDGQRLLIARELLQDEGRNPKVVTHPQTEMSSHILTHVCICFFPQGTTWDSTNRRVVLSLEALEAVLDEDDDR